MAELGASAGYMAGATLLSFAAVSGRAGVSQLLVSSVTQGFTSNHSGAVSSSFQHELLLRG